MKTHKMTEIARCRDGGSVLVQFDDEVYFIDHGIGSKTRGKVFYGRDRSIGLVPQELSDEIVAFWKMTRVNQQDFFNKIRRLW